MQTENRIAPILLTLDSPFKNDRTIRQRVRRSLIVLGVRAALAAGYVVVLVGPCRSGKTYILERVLQGRVIDKKPTVLRAGAWDKPFILAPEEIPAGRFGIDEVQLISPESLAAALAGSAAPYALALQPQDQQSAETIRPIIAKRRHVILTLGAR